MLVKLKDDEEIEIKTFQDYILWTRKLWSNIGDGTTHAILGIISELGEIADCFKKEHYGKQLDYVNLKEELGDLAYYIARYIDENDFRIPSTFVAVSTDSNVILIIKDVTLNISLYPTYGTCCRLYELLLSLIHHSMAISTMNVLETNIHKLETRYNKGKFDVEDATNRDLDKEKETLNGKVS